MFPHSNELNAERRSEGYKSEPESEIKNRPAPADADGPATTPDSRGSGDGPNGASG